MSFVIITSLNLAGALSLINLALFNKNLRSALFIKITFRGRGLLVLPSLPSLKVVVS